MSTVTVLYKRAQDIRFDVEINGKKHSLVVKGANSLIRDIDGKVIPSSALPFGDNAYGVTAGVDADLWAEVVKQYGSMNIFKMGVIRATTPKKEQEAKEEIKEVEKTDDPIAPASGDVDKTPNKRGRKKA